MLVSKKPQIGISGGYIQWNPNPVDIIEPTAPEKIAGWAPEQYPPSQYFNWFWNIVTKWTNFFAGTDEDAFVVSSSSVEGDYSTLQSAIAAGLTDGDTIFVKTDQTLPVAGGTVTLDKNVKIKIKKGVIFNVTGAWAPGSVVLEFAGEVTIEGDLILQSSATGTIDKMVKVNNDSCTFENIVINNSGAATVVNGFYIEAGVNATLGEGSTTNTGGGSFTNVLTDASGFLNNLVRVREI